MSEREQPGDQSGQPETHDPEMDEGDEGNMPPGSGGSENDGFDEGLAERPL